jgi:hypothetical protein
LSRTGDAGPALSVDVIGGSALVLRTLIEACGAAAVVVASEHDILNGIALSRAPMRPNVSPPNVGAGQCL